MDAFLKEVGAVATLDNMTKSMAELALWVRAYYDALRAQGFTTQQAMTLVEQFNTAYWQMLLARVHNTPPQS